MANEGNLMALLPLLVFMGIMVGISFWVRHSSQGLGRDFVSQYFIGNRDLGGFVLAMTTVATYSSVSSFVGGPGMAFSIGFGWIYMAVVQVTSIFLVLGIFGKRVALLSRRFDAVTVVDIIRERFQSDGLAAMAAFIIVLFFCGTMTAQFVGGAKLFATVTGYSYETGLLLFGLVVVVYTSIGGFRAVAFTDTCCALMMMGGIVLLLYYVLSAGGGYTAIMENIHVQHPEMLEPLSAGHMPVGLYLTQWILVGICTIALPQSVVRGISYKDTKSLHRAMLIGTVVVGFMNIGVNFTGILAHGVLSGSPADYGGVDYIIPKTIVAAMPSALVGFASSASGGFHLDDLGSLDCRVVCHRQGCLSPLQAEAGRRSPGAPSAPAFRRGDGSHRCNGVLHCPDATEPHLDHQYVCLRRTRDGLLLDVAFRPVLEESKQAWRHPFDGRRYTCLLPDAGPGVQGHGTPSDHHRHYGFPGILPDRGICGQAC